MVTGKLGHRRLLRDPGVIAACVDCVASTGEASRRAA
jgi:hypothetical protein